MCWIQLNFTFNLEVECCIQVNSEHFQVLFICCFFYTNLNSTLYEGGMFACFFFYRTIDSSIFSLHIMIKIIQTFFVWRHQFSALKKVLLKSKKLCWIIISQLMYLTYPLTLFGFLLWSINNSLSMHPDF